MNIVQFMFSLASGGGERFVVDLSNSLVDAGHEVFLCVLRDDKQYPLGFNKQFLNPKIKFYSFRFTPGFSINKVYRVCRYLKSLNPDVIHCHLNVIPYLFPLALFNNKVKIFHTLHTLADKTCPIKAQKSLNRFFYKYNLIRPVTISENCKTSYEEFYHLKNAPYINNGRIPIEASWRYNEVVKEIESYKENSDTLVFVHVARYDKLKNQEMLVNAFNKLYSEGLDFILLVIGNGFDSESAIGLQRKACRKIHFLGEKNNVGDYLLCADAFCLTSVYEGLPISLLEALSAGITPICTTVGGIPDVITDGKYGYLSKDLSVDSYLEAIKRFIKRPIRKSLLIEYFNNNYSMTICANKYLNLYQLSRS